MVDFVAGVIERKHDFNYWLCFSQPPRKIRELLLGSRDLSASLESEACLSKIHTRSWRNPHTSLAQCTGRVSGQSIYVILNARLCLEI